MEPDFKKEDLEYISDKIRNTLDGYIRLPYGYRASKENIDFILDFIQKELDESKEWFEKTFNYEVINQKVVWDGIQIKINRTIKPDMPIDFIFNKIELSVK